MEAPGSHVPRSAPCAQSPVGPVAPPSPGVAPSPAPPCFPLWVCLSLLTVPLRPPAPPLTERHHDGAPPLWAPVSGPSSGSPRPTAPLPPVKGAAGPIPSPPMGGPLIALRPGPARRLCLLLPSLAPNSDPGPSGPRSGASVKGRVAGLAGGGGNDHPGEQSVSGLAREGLALEQGAGLSKAGGPARTGLPPLLRPRPRPGMFPPQEQEGVRLCRRPPPCCGRACVPQGPVLKLKPQRLRCGCIWRPNPLKRRCETTEVHRGGS